MALYTFSMNNRNLIHVLIEQLFHMHNRESHIIINSNGRGYGYRFPIAQPPSKFLGRHSCLCLVENMIYCLWKPVIRKFPIEVLYFIATSYYCYMETSNKTKSISLCLWPILNWWCVQFYIAEFKNSPYYYSVFHSKISIVFIHSELEVRNQELCIQCEDLERENVTLRRDVGELQTEVGELQLLVEDLQSRVWNLVLLQFDQAF